MNFGSLLGGLAGGALTGYGLGGNFGMGSPNNASFLLPQGAEGAMNQAQSTALPGILPGASVPLQTGAQGGGAFGGIGQGLTNSTAGLFQPNVSSSLPMGGNQMNPLVRALLMSR